MHGFAIHTHKKCKGIATFLYADTFCISCYKVWKTCTIVGAHFLHELLFFRTPGQVQQTTTMKGNYSLFGIVTQTLANDYEGLTIIISSRVREIDIGRK